MRLLRRRGCILSFSWQLSDSIREGYFCWRQKTGADNAALCDIIAAKWHLWIPGTGEFPLVYRHIKASPSTFRGICRAMEWNSLNRPLTTENTEEFLNKSVACPGSMLEMASSGVRLIGATDLEIPNIPRCVIFTGLSHMRLGANIVFRRKFRRYGLFI